MAGFEPTASSSRTKRASQTALHPDMTPAQDLPFQTKGVVGTQEEEILGRGSKAARQQYRAIAPFPSRG